MKNKIQLIVVAVVFFILGALAPGLFQKNYYEQKRNDNEAYSLNVELNANISNLKDFDEGREDMLKETLERDLSYSIHDAKILLSRKLSDGPKRVLSEKVATAELTLKNRTKTLDELLFSQQKP
jgi:hypothetical protein